MKSITSYLLLLAIAFSYTSCIPENVSPSGTVVQKSYELSNFSGLDICHAFNANIKFSDTEEVIVEADENLFEFIIVEKNGDNLSVRLKPGTNVNGSATFNLLLTAKQLNEVDASGASDIVFEDPIDQTAIRIDLSGASNIDAELKTDQTDIRLSGASVADLQGFTNVMNLDMTGASQVQDYDLTVNKLDVDARGASRIRLTVDKTIRADLGGASKLEFKGDAEIIQKELTGGSEIINRS